VPSTVTNLNDAGDGSLRQAIRDTPAGDTVDFQPGLSGTITLTTGELLIAKDLTIAGPGAGLITVSGHQSLRVFDIAASFTVSLSALTIADGRGPAPGGGGVLNSGTLTLTDCTLSGNTALGYGGAIYNTGTLTVTGSTLTRNLLTNTGGIFNTGALTVTDSTIRDNSGGIDNRDTGTASITDSTVAASTVYGGISNQGTMTITGSTVSNNSSSGNAGGVRNLGVLTITNSTITGNFAGSYGGGILHLSGSRDALTVIASCTITANSAFRGGGGVAGAVTLGNTIVAGNTSEEGSGDLSATLLSQGHNLIGDGSGGIGFTDTDLVGTHANPIDPLLGPLQDHGGRTQTMALLPGSPALNAGDAAQLGVPDQRGVVRTGGVNIGAYQASASTFLLTAPVKVRSGIPFDLTVTAVDPFGQVAAGYTGTVTFRTTDPDSGVVLPADYAFTAADAGVHFFSDTGLGETTLVTRGYQSIAVTDTADGSLMGSATVKVRHLRRHDGGNPGLAAGQDLAAADRVFAALQGERFVPWLASPGQRNGDTGPWD
jgi:predicted outer membrane repeat protein